MATRLGDMAVGSTVKIKVDGTAKDFIIVHQGNPDSTIYDSSCDGTWVLMKDIYDKRQWHSSNINDYANSTIHSYLNSTFLNLFEPSIKHNIKQVKIPYRKGSGTSTTVTGGSNGLSAKIFLLSMTELSFVSNYIPRGEGAELAYFKGCSNDSPDRKRIAYYNGNVTAWWVRSPGCVKAETALLITNDGSWYGNECTYSLGARPALILPSILLVSYDGTVIGNFDPEVTSDAGASGAELGEKNAPFTVGYTVTDKNGDLMTVTEKLDGTEQAVKTKVATGTALTVDWLSEKVGYQQVLNGTHTLTLTVSDGIASTDWTATFTKNVTGAKVSLTAPLTADDAITVAAMTLEGSFPADMSLTVEMTNNALDDSPVWENCTDIQSGESRAFVHHAFTNKTAARGFAFNYKITAARGASGVGGTITMIGGVIG